MLQNAKVTAFTVSALLRENQQEWGGGGSFRVKYCISMIRSRASLIILNKVSELIL